MLTPRWEPGALVAEHTATANTDSGPCGVCGRIMFSGQRIAQLVDGTGRWAHAGCLQYLEPPQRTRTRMRAGLPG